MSFTEKIRLFEMQHKCKATARSQQRLFLLRPCPRGSILQPSPEHGHCCAEAPVAKEAVNRSKLEWDLHTKQEETQQLIL